MNNYTTSVVRQVLNEKTGELEKQRFTSDKQFGNTAKQGWRRMYTGYDEILMSMSSPKEVELMIYIKDMFKKTNTEVGVVQTDIALMFNVSPGYVNKLLAKFVRLDLLMKIRRGVYRLNPYIYIPYNADGFTLQKEWDELKL